MSNWKIIIPEATTNLVTNPSFETGTTGWTTGGWNTIAQSADYQTNGVYSLKCTYSNNDILASYAITLTAAVHTIAADIYIPSNYDGTDLQLQLQNFTSATITNADVDMTIRDKWQRVKATITPDAGDLAGNIVLYENGTAPTATRLVYLDSVQCEAKAYATTYCDGSLQGCNWNGTVHAATSTRDELEPTGGKLNDLSDNLNFIVADQDGTGMPPVNNLSSPLALQPGELFEDQTIAARSFSLKGSIVGGTPEDFHNKKRGLVAALNPKTMKINERAKPRTFRYTGALTDKEIQAVYDGGLEKGLPLGWSEMEIGLRLKADDPMFYGVGNKGATLATSANVSMNRFLRRVNNTWSNMGVTLSGGGVYAYQEDSTYIYVGGSFPTINSITNTAYTARYNKSTSTWSAIGGATNKTVYALAKDASGNIYACGNFTTIGGVSANRIAYWDGLTWNALGTGLNNLCYDVKIAPNGNVYACGIFTTAGGVTVGKVAYWDGSAWNAIGTGISTGYASTIAFDTSGNVYLGGNFTTIDAVTANNIAFWQGSGWEAMSGGVDDEVRKIVVTDNGTVYACGDFLNAGSISANRAVIWNGSTWIAMGSGLGGDCYNIEIAADGTLYFVGNFTTAGGKDIPGYFATWNGSEWGYIDVAVGAVALTIYTNDNDDIYIGTGSFVTVEVAGKTTIDYYGTSNAYPIIKIKRVGGTSAKLFSVKQLTTGANLLFDYPIKNGEEITIKLLTSDAQITSSSDGNLYNILYPSSDFGDFFIMAGNTLPFRNIISCLVDTVGSPTITATIEWRDTFISED